MPRYINAEDFKHLINASSLYDTKEWVKVMELLADTPTADAVEVVRCKDCVHRHRTTCPFLIANAYKTSSDDDFCSRGERREDDA